MKLAAFAGFALLICAPFCWAQEDIWAQSGGSTIQDEVSSATDAALIRKKTIETVMIVAHNDPKHIVTFDPEMCKIGINPPDAAITGEAHETWEMTEKLCGLDENEQRDIHNLVDDLRHTDEAGRNLASELVEGACKLEIEGLETLMCVLAKVIDSISDTFYYLGDSIFDSETGKSYSEIWYTVPDTVMVLAKNDPKVLLSFNPEMCVTALNRPEDEIIEGGRDNWYTMMENLCILGHDQWTIHRIFHELQHTEEVAIHVIDEFCKNETKEEEYLCILAKAIDSSSEMELIQIWYIIPRTVMTLAENDPKVLLSFNPEKCSTRTNGPEEVITEESKENWNLMMESLCIFGENEKRRLHDFFQSLQSSEGMTTQVIEQVCKTEMKEDEHLLCVLAKGIEPSLLLELSQVWYIIPDTVMILAQNEPKVLLSFDPGMCMTALNQPEDAIIEGGRENWYTMMKNLCILGEYEQWRIHEFFQRLQYSQGMGAHIIEEVCQKETKGDQYLCMLAKQIETSSETEISEIWYRIPEEVLILSKNDPEVLLSFNPEMCMTTADHPGHEIQEGDQENWDIMMKSLCSFGEHEQWTIHRFFHELQSIDGMAAHVIEEVCKNETKQEEYLCVLAKGIPGASSEIGITDIWNMIPETVMILSETDPRVLLSFNPDICMFALNRSEVAIVEAVGENWDTMMENLCIFGEQEQWQIHKFLQELQFTEGIATHVIEEACKNDTKQEEYLCILAKGIKTRTDIGLTEIWHMIPETVMVLAKNDARVLLSFNPEMCKMALNQPEDEIAEGTGESWNLMMKNLCIFGVHEQWQIYKLFQELQFTEGIATHVIEEACKSEMKEEEYLCTLAKEIESNSEISVIQVWSMIPDTVLNLAQNDPKLLLTFDPEKCKMQLNSTETEIPTENLVIWDMMMKTLCRLEEHEQWQIYKLLMELQYLDGKATKVLEGVCKIETELQDSLLCSLAKEFSNTDVNSEIALSDIWNTIPDTVMILAKDDPKILLVFDPNNCKTALNPSDHDIPEESEANWKTMMESLCRLGEDEQSLIHKLLQDLQHSSGMARTLLEEVCENGTDAEESLHCMVAKRIESSISDDDTDIGLSEMLNIIPYEVMILAKNDPKIFLDFDPENCKTILNPYDQDIPEESQENWKTMMEKLCKLGEDEQRLIHKLLQDLQHSDSMARDLLQEVCVGGTDAEESLYCMFAKGIESSISGDDANIGLSEMLNIIPYEVMILAKDDLKIFFDFDPEFCKTILNPSDHDIPEESQQVWKVVMESLCRLGEDEQKLIHKLFQDLQHSDGMARNLLQEVCVGGTDAEESLYCMFAKGIESSLSGDDADIGLSEMLNIIPYEVLIPAKDDPKIFLDFEPDNCKTVLNPSDHGVAEESQANWKAMMESLCKLGEDEQRLIHKLLQDLQHSEDMARDLLQEVCEGATNVEESLHCMLAKAIESSIINEDSEMELSEIFNMISDTVMILAQNDPKVLLAFDPEKCKMGLNPSDAEVPEELQENWEMMLEKLCDLSEDEQWLIHDLLQDQKSLLEKLFQYSEEMATDVLEGMCGNETKEEESLLCVLAKGIESSISGVETDSKGTCSLFDLAKIVSDPEMYYKQFGIDIEHCLDADADAPTGGNEDVFLCDEVNTYKKTVDAFTALMQTLEDEGVPAVLTKGEDCESNDESQYCKVKNLLDSVMDAVKTAEKWADVDITGDANAIWKAVIDDVDCDQRSNRDVCDREVYKLARDTMDTVDDLVRQVTNADKDFSIFTSVENIAREVGVVNKYAVFGEAMFEILTNPKMMTKFFKFHSPEEFCTRDSSSETFLMCSKDMDPEIKDELMEMVGTIWNPDYSKTIETLNDIAGNSDALDYVLKDTSMEFCTNGDSYPRSLDTLCDLVRDREHNDVIDLVATAGSSLHMAAPVICAGMSEYEGVSSLVKMMLNETVINSVVDLAASQAECLLKELDLGDMFDLDELISGGEKKAERFAEKSDNDKESTDILPIIILILLIVAIILLVLVLFMQYRLMKEIFRSRKVAALGIRPAPTMATVPNIYKTHDVDNIEKSIQFMNTDPLSVPRKLRQPSNMPPPPPVYKTPPMHIAPLPGSSDHSLKESVANSSNTSYTELVFEP